MLIALRARSHTDQSRHLAATAQVRNWHTLPVDCRSNTGQSTTALLGYFRHQSLLRFQGRHRSRRRGIAPCSLFSGGPEAAARPGDSQCGGRSRSPLSGRNGGFGPDILPLFQAGRPGLELDRGLLSFRVGLPVERPSTLRSGEINPLMQCQLADLICPGMVIRRGGQGRNVTPEQTSARFGCCNAVYMTDAGDRWGARM